MRLSGASPYQDCGLAAASPAGFNLRYRCMLVLMLVRMLPPVLLRDERRCGRRVKHLQVFRVVIGHRRQRDIHVFEPPLIGLDPLVNAA